MIKFEISTAEAGGVFLSKPPLQFHVAPRIGEQLEISGRAFQVIAVRHTPVAEGVSAGDVAAILVIKAVD